MSVRKRFGASLGAWLRSCAARLISTDIAVRKLRQKTYPQFEAIYGDFRFGEDWRSSSRRIAGNESGIILGSVVRMLGEVSGKASPLLLAGESGVAKPVYAGITGAERIVTAGLHADADCRWDFEKDSPISEPFQCIVSHAIIEHLIDPYRHISDLVTLLGPGGNLIIYTVMPGFPYHRYPVDCLRFFPDWFEEVAKRHGLTVADKFLGDEHIVYRYFRP